jgi:hypothetical protein
MMEREEKQIEKAVVLFNAKLLGVVVGLLFGSILFLATIFLVIKGGPTVGTHMMLLSNFFPGYRVTFLGGIIGFFYAFLVGFLSGALLGVVYNKITVA